MLAYGTVSLLYKWKEQYTSHFRVDPDRVIPVGESSEGGFIQPMVTMSGGQGLPPPFEPGEYHQDALGFIDRSRQS
jgi:hypothetical protein